MILLSVDKVTKHYGPEPVLSGVTFDVRPGERIGLVGPNGTGKTTLLKILAGREEPDGGMSTLHGSARLGYLEQDPNFPAQATVWDQAREALGELVAMNRQAEQAARGISRTDNAAERRALEQRFDHLQQELHRRDGYHLDHKIERVLLGLGFPPETHRQPVAQLSGGQQNRLMLAQLLLAEPEVMLLDEPSNHLDIEGTEWLEAFLTASRQAMILVSHDRYFLDTVANRTLELFRGTIDSFSGNFSAYWRQKAERLEFQRRTYQRQQTEIAKLETFVARNRYGQKHAQAEDRAKKLQRIEPVDPPREIEVPPMGFPAASRSGDVVLRVEHVSKAFDKPLFANLSFDVLRGQRWGILGGNGTGKTTLLRCVLREQTVDEGQIVLGTGVEIAYFDQQLAGLDPDEELAEAIRPPRGEFLLQQRRDMLARFGLCGDVAGQRVGSLSGGERNRAALARLAATRANFLILDEPTNHLDLWARDALEKSITAFDGSVLLVSHDRYFLNQVADHLLVVEPDRFRVVEGNYDLYQHLVREGLAVGDRAVGGDGRKPALGRDAQRSARKQATRRKRRFPYRKVEEIEAEIFQRETRVDQLHTALATPEVLRDGDKVRQMQGEIHQHQKALATLYEHWEEASEMN